MRRFNPRRLLRGRKRGAALIVALALVLCLTMIVVGTQLQVTTQLKRAKGQRDYDRALQMAEAGANAYLNYLSYGVVTSGSNRFLIPWGSTYSGSVVSAPVMTQAATGDIPSTTQIRADILAGNISRTPGTQTVNGYVFSNAVGFVNCPAQAAQNTLPAVGSQFGYFVILRASASATVELVSYGYSNGVVRRIKVTGESTDIFDWAAVYGMDPYDSGHGGSSGPGMASNQNMNGTDTGPAWDFQGGASIVGASGAEGYISYPQNGNVTWYDGAVILALNGNSLNTTNPTVVQSTPNDPVGHSGTGTIASPSVRRLARSLNIETADTAANRWALEKFGQTTTSGVEFFKSATYNNNSTGIRMLVKVTDSGDANYGKIRELPTAWPIPTTGQKAYELNWPQPSDITSAGKTSAETFLGLRMYPGNYYIQKWTQTSADVMYMRSTYDSTYVGYDGDGNSMPVYNSNFSSIVSTNPNTNMTSERNIRVWIGNPTTGNSPDTQFSDTTYMEDPTYASRFRLYVATKGSVTVGGTNQNPPRKFRVNILAKSSAAGTGGNAGQTVYYGKISIATGTYLYGSLLAWQVKVAGSCTIEKQASEGDGGGGTGSTDRLAYGVTGWTELP